MKRQVNQRFLTAMMDMGIPLERAELALCETGNVGVEVGPVLLSLRTFQSPLAGPYDAERVSVCVSQMSQGPVCMLFRGRLIRHYSPACARQAL